MMRPRGTPPTPSAASRPMEPVGMAFTSTCGFCPSIMMESSPNLVLISRKVSSILEALSFVPITFGSFVGFFFCICLTVSRGTYSTRGNRICNLTFGKSIGVCFENDLHDFFRFLAELVFRVELYGIVARREQQLFVEVPIRICEDRPVVEI